MKSIYPVSRAMLLTAIVLTVAPFALAQGGTFTYQGRLNDGGSPASGTYDLQFTLWDDLTSGNQLPVGSPLTVTRTGVPVANGVFTVQLDFTAAAFPGADRFLEISVKHPADSSYARLAPRVQLTSTPYAIRSANAGAADTATNATQLGGVAAAQYVQTADSRLSDARTPTAGSSNYVQNGTSQQASSNFNISGDGTAGGTLTGNIVSATTKYNIGANQVLGLGNNSTFVGVGAGAAITSGISNTFLGNSAGLQTDGGALNTFLGFQAGKSNTTGSQNVYVGNATGNGGNGTNDTFVGSIAGSNNSGGGNSFFGRAAGFFNTGATTTLSSAQVQARPAPPETPADQTMYSLVQVPD